MSETREAIDYSFAVLSCSEANHELYMVRTIAEHARSGRAFSEKELRERLGYLRSRIDAIHSALGIKP